jgi:hypothetical protein
MHHSKANGPLPGQTEFLLPGLNAIETSLTLAQSWTRQGRPCMLIDSVKRVLRTLVDQHMPYAIIGVLAVSHHSVPRLTQDVDLIVAMEDTARFRALFPNCYQRGTAVVEIYEIEGTRVDVLPAKLRYQREVLTNAVQGTIEGIPARIASVRDLVLLKMIAAPNRPELVARRMDETDITGLLEMNSASISRAEIQFVGDRLLELCFTVEDRDRAVRQIEWLNDTLVQLKMDDRCFAFAAPSA